MGKKMSDTSWNKEQLFSSEKHDWATPQALFTRVDFEFGFVLDAAASPHNTKCRDHLSVKDDALSCDWTAIAGDISDTGAVWLNPPYGRDIGKWIQKAYEESWPLRSGSLRAELGLKAHPHQHQHPHAY